MKTNTPTKTASLSMEDSVDFSAAASLVALCFESRTQTHFLHLQTRSYAQHKALETYYTDIIDLVDAYAEHYQGRYGIITPYPKVTFTADNAIGVIEVVRNWLDAKRNQCGDYAELQNDIDAILGLLNSTWYKLNFLS